MAAPHTVEVYGTEPDLSEGPVSVFREPHPEKEGHLPMRTTRSLITSLIALLLAGFVVVGTAPTATAADIYRYWAYFTVSDGEFVAQQTGPSGATPKDGSIEAYRYAAPADFKKPNLPRADLAEVTFESVCGDKTAEDGQKRVAVLIDYGVEADAPDGVEVPQAEALCAVVPAKANGLQTLQAVAPEIRTKKSSFGPQLCGISGYPATGCSDDLAEKGTPADGEPIEFATADSGDDNASDTSTAADEDEDESNLPMLLGIAALVVVIAVAGVVLSRRNRSAA